MKNNYIEVINVVHIAPRQHGEYELNQAAVNREYFFYIKRQLIEGWRILNLSIGAIQ